MPAGFPTPIRFTWPGFPRAEWIRSTLPATTSSSTSAWTRTSLLGNQSTATVRLKTVLGKRYLEIVPAGVVDDSDARVIPLSRTTVPYSLDDVSSDATTAATGVDLQAMESMMNTLSQVIPTDSDQVGGLWPESAAPRRLSRRTVNRSTRFSSCPRAVGHGCGTTDSIVGTAANAQTIVRTLAMRKDALTQLVDNLTIIISKLSTTFVDRQDEFGAMTDNLVEVTTTLKNNADQIDLLLTRLPSALRSVTDSTGTGNWTDVNAPPDPGQSAGRARHHGGCK